MRRSLGDHEPPPVEEDDEEVVGNFISSRSSSEAGDSEHWGLELERKQLELDSLQTQLQELKLRNSELTSSIEESQSRAADALERLDQANARQAEAESLARDLQRRLDDRNREAEAKIQILEQGLDDMKDYSQNVSQLTRDLQERDDELKELRPLKERVDQLQLDLAHARKTIGAASPAQTSELSIDEKNREISELRQKIATQEGQLRVLAVKVQTLNTAKEELELAKNAAIAAQPDASDEPGLSRKDLLEALNAEQNRYRLLRMLASALVYRAQTNDVLRKNS